MPKRRESNGKCGLNGRHRGVLRSAVAGLATWSEGALASLSPMSVENGPEQRRQNVSEDHADPCSVGGGTDHDSRFGTAGKSRKEGSTSRSLLAALKADERHAW